MFVNKWLFLYSLMNSSVDLKYVDVKFGSCKTKGALQRKSVELQLLMEKLINDIVMKYMHYARVTNNKVFNIHTLDFLIQWLQLTTPYFLL